MRPPVQVWESHHGEDDLTKVTRRYLAAGGARMTRTQVHEAENLTPLERALTPAR